MKETAGRKSGRPIGNGDCCRTGFQTRLSLAKNVSIQGYVTIRRQAKNEVSKPVMQQAHGGYNDVDPPLPIPNREVKRVCADGTARPGGRVGSRRPIKRSQYICTDSFFYGYLLEHLGGNRRTSECRGVHFLCRAVRRRSLQPQAAGLK